MNTTAAIAEATRLGGDIHLTWKAPKELQRRLMSAGEYQLLLAELDMLRRFRAAAEPVLQRIYDVLYFDSDQDCFDPEKEWDSPCDFIEMVNDEILKFYGPPKAGSDDYPPIKEKS